MTQHFPGCRPSVTTRQEEDPEQSAYGARIRFLAAMGLLGFDVPSGAVQQSARGEWGVRIGVVEPAALDQVSELLEAHHHARRPVDAPTAAAPGDQGRAE